MTATVLQRLCARRLQDVERARAERPLDDLVGAVRQMPMRPYERSLAEQIRAAGNEGRRAIIAELKRASPSAGLIRDELDVPGRVRAYRDGGAVGFSILTEPHEFLGSDDDLAAARETAPDRPILRKDFVIDEWQLWETRVLGADVALLIVSVLGDRLARFLEVARDAGLEALVETHDDAELDLALESGAELIGINARNLHTFETSLEWVEQRIGRIPADRIAIAESGIRGTDDMNRLAAAGARAFLIGETLMRSDAPGELLRTWGARA